MPWRWGPPNRGIRASASYASPPYSGASCVFCFYRRGVPTLANLVVPLFLIASLCSMSKRGDFFLPRCGPSYAVPSCLRFASPHSYHAVGRSLGRFASSHPIISSMDGSACPACLPPASFPHIPSAHRRPSYKTPRHDDTPDGEENETGLCCLLASAGRAVMWSISFPHAGIATTTDGICVRQCHCLISSGFPFLSIPISPSPPPHRLLFLIRRPQSFPRPLGGGGAGVNQISRGAGGWSVRLLRSFLVPLSRYRSFAIFPLLDFYLDGRLRLVLRRLGFCSHRAGRPRLSRELAIAARCVFRLCGSHPLGEFLWFASFHAVSYSDTWWSVSCDAVRPVSRLVRPPRAACLSSACPSSHADCLRCDLPASLLTVPCPHPLCSYPCPPPVMSSPSLLSHLLAPRALIAPRPVSSTRMSGAVACFPFAMPFMSARRGIAVASPIISSSVLSSCLPPPRSHAARSYLVRGSFVRLASRSAPPCSHRSSPRSFDTQGGAVCLSSIGRCHPVFACVMDAVIAAVASVGCCPPPACLPAVVPFYVRTPWYVCRLVCSPVSSPCLASLCLLMRGFLALPVCHGSRCCLR